MEEIKDNSQELQQLCVYYKGKLMREGKDFTFDHRTQQVNFKTQVQSQFVQTRWEIIEKKPKKDLSENN